MFGYVKPHIPELLVKEHEFYKATYCGVCRSMKRHTGKVSNATLSYDSVLLALVRMLFIPDSEIGAKKSNCIAHPIKKRPMLRENSATEYTARAFAILTYYKMLDDVADEGFLKKLLAAPIRPVLAHGKKKAKCPDIASVIHEKLSKISELEAENIASVDEPAELSVSFSAKFSQTDFQALMLSFAASSVCTSADLYTPQMPQRTTTRIERRENTIRTSTFTAAKN